MEGVFPTGATKEINVTYEIEAGSAACDKGLQFAVGSEWNEIFLGINSGGAGYTGGVYYVDDFQITANVAPPVVVIPKLDITPAKKGLHLVCADSSQWARQGIRTTTADYTWVDRAGPVTYAMNIKQAPKVAGQNVVIYLTPGADGSSSPDWSYPQCLRLAVITAADGSAQAALAYKDGPAESNGTLGHEYWIADDGLGSGGNLAYLNSTKTEGEWSVRFNTATSITFTAPDGATANASILASTAAKFALSTTAYFSTLPTVRKM